MCINFQINGKKKDREKKRKRKKDAKKKTKWVISFQLEQSIIILMTPTIEIFSTILFKILRNKNPR
jgi:hypothetical protein